MNRRVLPFRNTAVYPRAIASGMSVLMCLSMLMLPVSAEEIMVDEPEAVIAETWGDEEDCASGAGMPIPTEEIATEPTYEELPEETEPQEQPAPEPEETEPDLACAEYTVPQWVTLSAIAEYYGVTEDAILALNDVETVQPGDVLRIPVDPSCAPEPYIPPEHYTAQPGDTLAGIAERYGVPLESLCRWNHFLSSYELGVGKELLIPSIPELGQGDGIVGYSVSCADAYSAGQPLEVPLYFQTDYPDALYGEGTVATDGCGITSLAMVATALTGHTYLPDELAEYFGGRADNNVARLEYASEKLALPYLKSPSWNATLDALKQGKLVIALMSSSSLFTTTQHFIVLTGVDEDGRIWVNDPSAPNYDKWDLKEGFANGFSASQILQGYSGAWIYDPGQMPQQVPVYEEARLDRSVSNFPSIQLTPEERQLLASVIWVEARGESLEGQQAVAEVVFNRMLSSQFSDTLNDVIYGKEQFRSVPYLKDAQPQQAQYQAIDRALYGQRILPSGVVYFARMPSRDAIWGEIGHHVFCYG